MGALLAGAAGPGLAASAATPPEIWRLRAPSLGPGAETLARSAGERLWGLLAADLDGDGRQETIGGAVDGLVVLPTDARAFGRPRRVGLPGAGFLTGLAAADFDADGDLDVFAATEFGHLVVCRNTGDGRLEPAAERSYGTGARPARRVQIAAVPRIDGRPGTWILLPLGPDGLVAVPIDAAGTPGDPLSIAGGTPVLVRTVDADGDGRLDAVLTDEFGPLRLVLRRADGGWSDPAELTDPAVFTDVDVADLDGDGRADVVATIAAPAGAAQYAILMNDPEGALATARPSGAGSNALGPRRSALIDADGDGQLDIVTTRSSAAARIQIHRGRGDGTFEPVRRDRSLLGGGPMVVVAGADGATRLVLSPTSSPVATVAMLGRHTSGAAGDVVTVRGGDLFACVELDPGGAGAGDRAIAALDRTIDDAPVLRLVDVDARGRPVERARFDLELESVDGGVPSIEGFAIVESGGGPLAAVLLERGAAARIRLFRLGPGAIEPAGVIPVPAHTHAFTFAELGGEPGLDLVVAHGGPPSISVLWLDDLGGGNPDRLVLPTLVDTRPVPWGDATVEAIAAGDLTGDGTPEIFFSERSSPGIGAGRSVWVTGMGGAGRRLVPPVELTANGASIAGRSLVIGDWEDDGVLDLVRPSAEHGVVLVSAGPGGRLSARVPSLGGHVTQMDEPAVADIDGDGDLDVLSIGWAFGPEPATLGVIEQRAAGTDTEVTGWTTLLGAVHGRLPSAVADIDGDGSPDLVALHPPIAGEPIRLSVRLGGTPPIPCPADLDRDGVVGLDDLTVLLADFGAAATGPLARIADLDEDGTVDAADLARLLADWGSCAE